VRAKPLVSVSAANNPEEEVATYSPITFPASSVYIHTSPNLYVLGFVLLL
jgi:hypothetical protein